MAITTQAGLIAAMKASQMVTFLKTASRTSIAATWFSVFDLAGMPAAGTLAGTSTAAGVVPTSSTTGCPTIDAFGGGNTGYISDIEHGSSVACRWRIYDMLFKAGAYAFNAATTLASQPSYSARVPSSDYGGTQIWIEAVTAFTGTPSIAVTYTNQAGTTGRTTGTISLGAAPTVGKLFQMPLQAGDTGVQKIESVTATVATVGTFNVLVLRRLCSGRIDTADGGSVKGFDLTGLSRVFATSALYLMVAADSTATGVPELQVQVING